MGNLRQPWLHSETSFQKQKQNPNQQIALGSQKWWHIHVIYLERKGRRLKRARPACLYKTLSQRQNKTTEILISVIQVKHTYTLTHTHIFSHTHSPDTHTYAHIHTYIHLHLHRSTHTQMHVHTHSNIHSHNTLTHTFHHTHTYLCTHAHIRKCVYTLTSGCARPELQRKELEGSQLTEQRGRQSKRLLEMTKLQPLLQIFLSGSVCANPVPPQFSGGQEKAIRCPRGT